MQNKLNLQKKNILVLGDVMIDCYYYGKIKRVSPEAPVPVFLKGETKFILGGAANVAANLVAANQKVYLASVIGQDEAASVLLRMLTETGCNCSGIVRSEERRTTIKTRLLAQNNQQVIRIDEEQTNQILLNEETELYSNINRILSKLDLIVISDYLKGVLTHTLVQKVISSAKGRDIPVFIDIKDNDLKKYCGATLLKPNRNELAVTTGLSTGTNEEILKAAKALKYKCECEYVLATLGSKGMLLVGNDIEEWIPCVEHEVYDVSGAGDTVISYLAAGVSNGYSIVKASYLANFAAGIKVTKIGTAPVTLEELINLQNKEQKNCNMTGKLVRLDEMKSILKCNKKKKVVFTNGCFDILHSGHVRYLKQAANFGDLLIVGLNSDESVKRLKGQNRPINSQTDRAMILGALEFVDYIVIFDEDTPLNLIENIVPEVLVKGADYKKEDVVGAEFVETNGGRVELVPFVEGYSTTNIIKKQEII